MEHRNCVVVIPTLNEVSALPAMIADLAADPGARAIWIVDGGSTDGTRALALALGRTIPGLRLIHNPGRHQSAGVSLAAQQALSLGFDVMVRADAHARYPAGFVSGLLDVLARTGADSVTIPRLADPALCAPGWQESAARLQSGWLGHGGAAHRRAGRSGWTGHGHHAAFRLERFVALGGYDPRFAAAEDVDFDTRLTRAGGRIWHAAGWPMRYQPRSGPGAVFAQMRRNGRGRMQWARKHGIALGRRQVLPVLAQGIFAAALVALPVAPALALGGLVYPAAIAALAARMATGPVDALRIATLAFVAQAGFALGVAERGLAPRLRPHARALAGPSPVTPDRRVA